MDGTNNQVNFKLEDPANFLPPKIEISGIEAKPAPPRPHKLKPRDMNVLTPSGFWSQTSCVVAPLFHIFFFLSTGLLLCFPAFLCLLSHPVNCLSNEHHL